MDKRTSDLENQSDDSADADAVIEAAAEILDRHDSHTDPSGEGRNDGEGGEGETYATRLSPKEAAFVDAVRETHSTNKATALRILLDMAAVHLLEASSTSAELQSIDDDITEMTAKLETFEKRLQTLDRIGIQLNRIEEQLGRTKDEAGTSSSWDKDQGADDDDDEDEESLYDVADPEDIDIDLPDPDEV